MNNRVQKVRLLFMLLVVALLVGSLAGMSIQAQEGPPGLERALQAQQHHTRALMANSDVVGTAVTEMGGGRAAVMILVRRGGVAGLPASLDGVPVVISVTGEIVALSDCPTRTDRWRPACIGISTGHPLITAGTIGARVRNNSGALFALSNNHVYAAMNAAPLGSNVLQPGTYDGGSNPADAIGTLAAYEPIVFGGSCVNVIDAAIASLADPAILQNFTPANGYGTPRSTIVSPALRMRVMKYGRTTGQTSGRITGLNATVNVNYGSAGIACFVGQFLVGGGGFSSGGDSGSLIVANGGANDRKPVGLLFAGSSSVTIANPIGAVLNEFGVTVDGPA